ncbi:transglutaminase family protein [Geitlerinema sp. PCC 9228]|uniref:transglutaminase-like domain-containing protein n=1 Tax=Geitlerinema sp. PCC 9228 TaxID=111611 RepID=UPI0008F9C615|nr:transglutaminase family protein [Geitlerinema sp. PCC 9228]
MNQHQQPNFRSQKQPSLRSVRPYGVRQIHGLASWGNYLLTLDPVSGYLLAVDPANDNTIVLNPHQRSEFLGATDLALSENIIWFARGDSIYTCEFAISGSQIETIQLATPSFFVALRYTVNGVAVQGQAVYVSCERAGYILVFHQETAEEITRFYAPGVGVETLLAKEEELWVADAIEQMVYCLDRATGELQYNVLTPFEHPTGVTFFPHPDSEREILYVAYASEEPYVRDDPNAANPYQLTFRDRTFIHPLSFTHNPSQRYTLSNGYLVEMSYVEELAPLDPVELQDLEWRIALPNDTQRQKVLSIEPIGMNFTEEMQQGSRVAVFRFDCLQANEARIFGWKVLLEVYSIKYYLAPPDIEDSPKLPPELADAYLVDNDNLSMDADIVQRAAKNAIGDETNLLRQVLSIRDYVYERLGYRVTVQIESPDRVLERGVGSCGEYVGVLLALMRLNGIACRTVGRYKCPPYAERQGVPLEPDFNHVWLEFYVPGYGWIPMESNPDNLEDRRIKPTRFFMGLAWYHVEIGKGTKFEQIRIKGEPVSKEQLALGDLAINHVRFQIVREIDSEQAFP